MEQQIWNWIEDNKNWGKWGDDDQKGTLNYITADVRIEALKIPTKGKLISLSRTIEFFGKTPDVTNQPQRFMLECGLGREHDDEYSNGVGSRGAPKEQISLVFHGYTITHIDGFPHMSWKGRMYNNKPASLVTIHDGAKVNSVEAFREGIVTRGILIDIPLLKNKPWLELSEPFTREVICNPDLKFKSKDIENAEQLCNIKIKQGDFVFVRTGYWKRRSEVGPINPAKDGTSGPHPDITTLLKERKAAAFSSDTCNDIYPPPVHSIKNPFHIICLVSMGMPIIDNADLEELSQECLANKKWEFLVTVAPLSIQGGTGSPVNPVAML